MGKHVICDDELYHYGVKGMRWGIRKKYPSGFLNKKKQLKIVRVMEYDKHGQIGDERPDNWCSHNFRMASYELSLRLYERATTNW